MRSDEFFFLSIYLILPAALGPGGLLKSLTEMNTRNRKIMFLRSKKLLAHKADNLTAICELVVYTMWNPQHLTNLWPPWSVTGIASLHFYRQNYTCAIQKNLPFSTNVTYHMIWTALFPKYRLNCCTIGFVYICYKQKFLFFTWNIIVFLLNTVNSC
jgi:hypothetical protein